MRRCFLNAACEICFKRSPHTYCFSFSSSLSVDSFSITFYAFTYTRRKPGERKIPSSHLYAYGKKKKKTMHRAVFTSFLERKGTLLRNYSGTLDKVGEKEREPSAMHVSTTIVLRDADAKLCMY